MRRRPVKGCFCGYAAIGAGVCIFIVLLMPAWFWWLLCAGLLIYGGCRLLWF